MASPAHARVGAHVQAGYRADIDGLRAVAILPVVCFHAFPAAMPGGFVGVDVFFVISGYLISGIILGDLARGRFSLADFYARRVRRIFPALAAVLGTSFLAGWVLLYPDEFRQLCKHIAAGAAFIANLVLRREVGYFDAAAETKPMLHLWSLGVEEQFYIVWPLLLWLGWRLRLNLRIVILAIGAASLAWNFWAVGAGDPKTFFSPLVRVWELAAGALMAQAAATGTGAPSRPAVADALSIAGAALLVGALVLLDRTMPFPGWRAIVPVAGACLLIAAGPGALVNRLLLAHPAMVWVGLISYPLYLWHWPLLAFGHLVAPAMDVAVRAALVGAAFVLAALTYVLIETPIRRGFARRLSVPMLAGLVACIGTAAFATYRLDGLPQRFPPLVGALAAYSYDHQSAYRDGTCFLGSPSMQTFADCVDPPVPGVDQPLVLLWGDSHAAHLYPGLARAGHRLAQFTAAACPPILDTDFSRPACRAGNDHVLARIAALRPNRVILSGNWAVYPEWRKVGDTVAALHRLGVSDVVLVGPTPRWTEYLPKLLMRLGGREGIAYPDRLTSPLVPAAEAIDREMSALAGQWSVGFVSPYRVLCDERGCLTHTGTLPDGLMMFDGDHLTAAGSDLVVGKVLPR